MTAGKSQKLCPVESRPISSIRPNPSIPPVPPSKPATPQAFNQYVQKEGTGLREENPKPSPFISGETEAWEAEVNCPKSHRRLVTEPGEQSGFLTLF